MPPRRECWCGFSGSFSQIADRFTGIEQDLGIAPVIAGHLEQFQAALARGVTADYAASRVNISAACCWLPGWGGVCRSCRVRHYRPNGLVDSQTWALLGDRLGDECALRDTGLYGRDTEGMSAPFRGEVLT